MTINTDLLVAAPMLQDYLVDKDTGFPLANGLVSLYKDTARSFYKNWYYQTGSPGAYSWIPLDNPMHLSSVGTIQDPNGNDVIPFYYPYQETNENTPETYYITVYSTDENGDPAILQFTRENFPFVASNVSPIATDPTFRNYILNNIYWRNIGSVDLMTVLDKVVAPSQHEGYTNGDIRFLKNVANADDDIAFLPMTESLDNDITPELYLNFTCDSVQVGETTKCIQYPISLHIKTLANVPATLVFHGQNVAGNPNNYVDLYIYQYLGTGALSQPDPILIQRVTLNNSFQRFDIPFIFPDNTGLVVGGGGDDALFLRVQYPLSAVFQINHTKPQLYLSPEVPDNDFDTYDQVETIINSPRTGDFRQSLNTFQPYGYVAANDGTIGSAAAVTTNRSNIDTWPLYSLIWDNYTNNFAPVIGGRGANAYTDFTANKALTLTRNLGRAIIGANPQFYPAVTFTADSATDILTLTTASTITKGTPIIVENTGGGLPSPLVADTVYFVSVTSLTTTTVKLSTTLENAYAGTNIDILTNGTGTQTMGGASGAFVGNTTHTNTIAELASHSHVATAGTGGFVEPTGPGGGTNIYSPGTSGTVGDIANTGGGAAYNIQPPEVYGNVFIKL